MFILRLCAAGLLAAGLSAPSPICACSVPVFRYALEQWQPDPYELILFHRGELEGAERALMERLTPEFGGALPANARLSVVDLDGDAGPAALALWESLQNDTLPLLAVQTPLRSGNSTPVWSGAFTAENVERLLDSPLRQEISQRIVDGDSVVWVFLDGGNPAEDDAAWELLNAELERLQRVLKLPEIDPADLATLSLDPTALKLRFSAVRVSRDDPAEKMLVEMLLRVEDDLLDPEFAGKPMAFPVFGRGRALYSLVGDGIAKQTIENASRFLVGACQCTVKAQNPGVDLLMSVDWDLVVEPTLENQAAPPLAGLGSFGVSDLFPPKTAPDAAAANEPAKQEQPEAVASAVDNQESDSAPGEEAVAHEADEASGESAHGAPPAKSTATRLTYGWGVFLVMAGLVVFVAVAAMIMAPRQR